MVDLREQVLAALQTVLPNTKMGFPEGQETLPLITYFEVTNVQNGHWSERVEFQVDVRTLSFETVVSLANQVDVVMTDMGFNRTYITPDSNTREQHGLYHKAISYVGYIDSLNKNIYGGFKHGEEV